jgi:hypothetical protein
VTTSEKTITAFMEADAILYMKRKANLKAETIKLTSNSISFGIINNLKVGSCNYCIEP